MPKTGADRQQAWRQRHARLVAALQADNTNRAPSLPTYADLADAHAEAGRLAAQQCRHPAPAVDGGHCHACGADVW